ncbi:hypothetical protein GGD63_002184 [Bradyrhizobium sp. cir1]|nr:hypothetical protein [Bradyrhizobium sp. cir1]
MRTGSRKINLCGHHHTPVNLSVSKLSIRRCGEPQQPGRATALPVNARFWTLEDFVDRDVEQGRLKSIDPVRKSSALETLHSLNPPARHDGGSSNTSRPTKSNRPRIKFVRPLHCSQGNKKAGNANSAFRRPKSKLQRRYMHASIQRLRMLRTKSCLSDNVAAGTSFPGCK